MTGASTANVALILVDARNGITEQSRRHAAIAALLDERPAPDAVRRFAAPYSWETNAAALHAHLAGLVSARIAQPSG